jgi:hypothetical protein
MLERKKDQCTDCLCEGERWINDEDAWVYCVSKEEHVLCDGAYKCNIKEEEL